MAKRLIYWEWFFLYNWCEEEKQIPWINQRKHRKLSPFLTVECLLDPHFDASSIFIYVLVFGEQATFPHRFFFQRLVFFFNSELLAGFEHPVCIVKLLFGSFWCNFFFSFWKIIVNFLSSLAPKLVRVSGSFFLVVFFGHSLKFH